MQKTDHDLLMEIHTVILGANGHDGLCRQVAKNSREIFKLWLAIVAMGVGMGGGVYGIIKYAIGG